MGRKREGGEHRIRNNLQALSSGTEPEQGLKPKVDLKIMT